MDDELRRLREDNAQLRNELRTARTRIKRLELEQERNKADRTILDRQVQELLQHAADEQAESETTVNVGQTINLRSATPAKFIADSKEENNKQTDLQDKPNTAGTEPAFTPPSSTTPSTLITPDERSSKITTRSDHVPSSSKALELVPEVFVVYDSNDEVDELENDIIEIGDAQQPKFASKPEDIVGIISAFFSGGNAATTLNPPTASDFPTAQRKIGGPRTKQTARKSTGGTPPKIKKLKQNVELHKRNPFFSKLENPAIRITVKSEAIRLPEDTVYARLCHLGDPVYRVTAPEALTRRTTTREFLSSTFGGNKYAFVQRLNPTHKAKHGYSHFLCPNLNTDPHAPQVPGAHGLLFRSEEDDDLLMEDGERNQKPHKVIAGLGPNLWLYTGDYELQESESLAPEQWGALPQKARDKWAMSIVKAKAGPRAQTRASIALRLQNKCEPSTSQIKNMVKTKGGAWNNIKPEDVKGAFQRGEERINVLVMKCVGYDEAFQQKLIDGPKARLDYVDSSKTPDLDESDQDSVLDEDVERHSPDSRAFKRAHSPSSHQEDRQPHRRRLALS
ncbi:hypothetical protein DFH11DRAFT_1304899 [Phellopilus nigrolimitatus]|nr:hypothetical protein DFH11DRAFT_1304899 [Phellopilus nigrolimitatus]